MKLEDKRLLKDALRDAAVIGLIILLCRFTKGGLTLAIAAYGVWAGLSHRRAVAIGCFLLYPLLTILNPAIIAGGTRGVFLRIGTFAMAFALVMSGSRAAGRTVLPLGCMVPYLFAAAISSLTGYAPLVSYMKLLNFVAILLGLWIGFKNIDRNPLDVLKVRKVFFAIVAFLILGSCLTILFPAYGYCREASRLEDCGLSMEEINEILKYSTGRKLFSGVTNQSQCLAVLMPCAVAWLLCDMLFVARRITLVHSVLIFSGLPLLYMTRSRAALVTALAAVTLIYFYALSRIPVKPRLKMALRSGMTGALVLIAILGVVAEIKDQSVTKWLRKTDDISSDQRSLGTAFTESRQGLMAESMRDFKKNPLIGMGFQVAWYNEHLKGKIVFSAPIEKGVLPVMVLGETGVLGAIAFAVFLLGFFGTCIKKRYVVTATLFATFLATNMGEATFFSPGGVGGILWVLCAGGGFTIDMLVIARKRNEYAFEMLYRNAKIKLLK